MVAGNFRRGTLVAGINLVTTVLKLRTRGMTYLRMPMFCWTTLATNLLIVAAFPILTATLAMLILDRYLGFHFFTNEAGGNMMMFMNLIWAWGHPEVYILVLPAFGIFSEVVATFSGKPLFGYRSMVLATMAICIISFMVWLHHFFTMGAGPDVNAIFAGFVGAVATFVVFAWRDHDEYVIPAAEVARIDGANLVERRAVAGLAGGA
jgi:cytochrome o ubiquinol oxidase subunit I